MSDSDFVKYRCWEDLAFLRHSDAAVLDNSVVQALHCPSTISLQAGDSEKKLTEQDVLELVTAPPALKEGYRLVPILGHNGSGKSHLVKWMQPHIENLENSVVIYVPRNVTGLSSLVDTILNQFEALEIEGVKELREQLRAAREKVDRNSVLNILLNRTQETVHTWNLNKNWGEELENQVNELAESIDLSPEEILSESCELVLPLLQNFQFRQLLEDEDRVIGRYVLKIFEDGDTDAEVLDFSKEDFPKSDEIGDIGKAEEWNFGQITGTQELLQAVCVVITEAVKVSIPQIFGVDGEVTVSSLFAEARKVLNERGESLFVLLEDLTSTVALQTTRQFVDVFIEIGSELCPVNFIFAVTTEVYNTIYEGFRNRVRDSCPEINGQIVMATGTLGEDSDEILTKFTSYYMAALRVGETELKEAYDLNKNNREWVHNKCNDCLHIDKCHTSFGAVEGIGLYPFNRKALLSTYEGVLEAEPELLRQFNPRRFISGVLLQVLQAFPEDNFPTNLLEKFNFAPVLPGATRRELQAIGGDERREALLKFWGGAPNTVQNLEDGIHEAFGIPKLDGKAPVLTDVCIHGVPKTQECKECSSIGPVNPVGPSESKHQKNLSEWADHVSVLKSETGNFLNSKIEEEVIRRIDWHGLGLPAPLTDRNTVNESSSTDPHSWVVRGPKALFRRFSVHIEDQTGIREDNTVVVRKLTRRDDFGLLYALAQKDHSPEEFDLDGYIELEEFFENLVQEITEKARERIEMGFRKESKVVQLLSERLAIGSLISGDCISEDPSEIDHIFLAEIACLETRDLLSEDNGTEEWAALIAALFNNRKNFQERLFHHARTNQTGWANGSVLRTGRIAYALKGLLEEWKPLTKLDDAEALAPESDPQRLTPREFKANIFKKVDVIQNSISSIQELLGEEPLTWKHLKKSIDEALQLANWAEIGKGVSTEIEALVRKFDEFSPVEEFQKLASVEKGTTVTEKELFAIGKFEQLKLEKLLKILNAINNKLDLISNSAKQELQGGEFDVSENRQNFVNAINELEMELREI